MVRVSFDIPDEALRASDQPRHKPMMTYKEAGELLSIASDGVAKLVGNGTLDRPEWTKDEVRVRLVTTASVYKAAGWPVLPLAHALPG